jgi:hypothetical protein
MFYLCGNLSFVLGLQFSFKVQRVSGHEKAGNEEE